MGKDAMLSGGGIPDTNKMMALQAEDDEAYGCRIPEGFDGERAKEVLEQLPSAQPEIIRCKDCAHLDEEIGWNGEKYMTCFLSPLPPVRMADDFCSLAERRIDE